MVNTFALPGLDRSKVVAHLTLTTRESWKDFVVGMIKNRGNFDRLAAANARHHAARHTPTDLIAQLRESAESNRRAPGSSPLDPLLDLLVHHQDIARALGHRRPTATEPGIAALEHALASRGYGAKQRFAGLRLAASDAEWGTGNGPEVCGPITALLLVATGRRVGLIELSGDGLPNLTQRMSNT